MGVGYFETEAKERFRGQLGGITFTGRITADIEVIPVTLTLKGILPYKRWEFFGLGGIGAYIVSGEKTRLTVDGIPFEGDLKDNDTIFGFHLGLGFHYNITPTIFIGAEGKYLWTKEAKLQDEAFGIPIEAKFKMDGILATAVIGFRF
jgi:opacity protein-like surface antigen